MSLGRGTVGSQVMYFETGQGSCLSAGGASRCRPADAGGPCVRRGPRVRSAAGELGRRLHRAGVPARRQAGDPCRARGPLLRQVARPADGVRRLLHEPHGRRSGRHGRPADDARRGGLQLHHGRARRRRRDARLPVDLVPRRPLPAPTVRPATRAGVRGLARADAGHRRDGRLRRGDEPHPLVEALDAAGRDAGPLERTRGVHPGAGRARSRRRQHADRRPPPTPRRSRPRARAPSTDRSTLRHSLVAELDVSRTALPCRSSPAPRRGPSTCAAPTWVGRSTTESMSDLVVSWAAAPCDLAIVLCDGLSPGAVQRHGAALASERSSTACPAGRSVRWSSSRTVGWRSATRSVPRSGRARWSSSSGNGPACRSPRASARTSPTRRVSGAPTPNGTACPTSTHDGLSIEDAAARIVELLERIRAIGASGVERSATADPAKS